MRKKKESLIRKINRKIKEFDTYDRIYYEGKISSLLIVIISFVCMFLIGVILWMI